MLDIGLFAAAAAGLLSFLSPCVLPLVPPYLTWLAGSSLEEISGDGTLVRLHIRMIATTCSDASRPPVRIDRDQRGAGREGAVRFIC
jgi:Cytochrome C biogenesis protein transmembrane region